MFDELQHILRQMHLPDADIFGAASQLSHGQLQMFNLRYVFGLPTDFLLLDEPTNHLDSGHLSQLWLMLDNSHDNLVIASHHHLLPEKTDSIVEIESADKIDLIGGNYTTCRQSEQQRTA